MWLEEGKDGREERVKEWGRDVFLLQVSPHSSLLHFFLPPSTSFLAALGLESGIYESLQL